MPSNAEVVLTLRSQIAPQIAGAVSAYTSLNTAQQRAEQSALKYAAALGKVAFQDARTATEGQRLAVQTANVAKAQSQAEAAALRLANAQDRAASGNSFAAQTADAFKGSLLGIVGPAAIAAGALGLLVGTANSFKEAFVFKAQLDATTASLQIQLAGVRDSGAVFRDAATFADQYKYTQQETTAALRASIGVLRTSTSSADDLLGVLARLQVSSPEQGLEGAALAVKELTGGDITSLVERFEISRTAANKMKEEIKGGADAVVVLGRYLDSTGIGMDALAVGSTGAAGAIRDVARAQEELKIAQGQIATSQGGIAVVDGIATAYRGLARLLNGDVTTGFKAGAANNAALAAQMITYYTALAAGKSETEATALGQASFNAVLQQSIDELNLLPASAGHGSKALFAIVPAANAASAALDALNNKKVLPHIEDKTVIGAAGGLGDLLTKGGNVAAAAAKKSDAEAQRLRDANDALRLARATTSAQKIAELQRQQRATSDPVERIRLQTQIEQERNSSAKSHTGELNKQLNLNESIYDSIAKQRDAQLDIEELLIRDRQTDRDDVQKKKTALAILNSPNASADMKGRAADALALIDVQDRKRANELASKGATAGGQIINGKVFQGVPGAALPPSPGGTSVGALPPSPGAPAGAGGGAGGSLTVNLVVDGKTLASVSEPYIMDALMNAIRGGRMTIGG